MPLTTRRGPVTNEPHRRDRLRLARRRSAPNRVRVRLREERPEPQPDTGATRIRRAWQRIQRASWAHTITVIGTALAAIAAIGGL